MKNYYSYKCRMCGHTDAVSVMPPADCACHDPGRMGRAGIAAAVSGQGVIPGLPVPPVMRVHRCSAVRRGIMDLIGYVDF